MDYLNQIFEQYVRACEEEHGAIKCGDLVRNLDNETCKELYKLLAADERTKDKLVRCLWYNYDQQSLRWQDV
jgi:hypothetical protein